MRYVPLALLVAGLLVGPRLVTAAPLQSFVVRDYLDYEWTDELVHFPISYSGRALPQSLALTDEQGQAVPAQVTGLALKDGKITGTAWTVVSLPPRGALTLQLVAGKSAPTGLKLLRQGKELVLSNETMRLRLPNLPGKLAQPVDLTTLPAPVLAAGEAGNDAWLGAGTWVNQGDPLQVKEATTTVLEEGPVRVTVRYRLTFTGGQFYQADLTLGHRQSAALFTDDTDVESPQAAFRFSLQPGLNADRVFWQNNYYADSYKGLTGDPIDFGEEKVVASLCPWTFWWLDGRTTWAGLYREEGDSCFGVVAIRPSRWTPIGWDGFDRTVIPITARQGGGLDLTLGLLAWTKKKPDGTTQFTPAHRELALGVGKASDYLDKPKMAILRQAAEARARQDMAAWNRLLGEGMWVCKLRRQLLQYSEFPLDEVKDYGFDFKPGKPDRKHPFLLFTQADIDRARKQAETVPMLKAELSKATTYMGRLGVDPIAKIQSGPDGWQRFYRENYVGNGLFECAPLAYTCSADPKYGLILAAGLKGLANDVVDQFLRKPSRQSIGSNAHLGGTNLLRVLFAYDALADTEYLTAEDKQFIRAVVLLGTYALAHPDWWNTEVGLCSANPNMTSLLRLPLGLQALFLDGHAKCGEWLKDAEEELQRELKDWVAPGGAWIECPMYQAVSLDGMFMLAQALKNVQGKDYFADPQFKATMEYYGFILTAPDVRFPIPEGSGMRPPMAVPSIGDAFPLFTTPFNGWMARATAESDPEFSARQQFYWQGQSYSVLNGGRANAFVAAMCDAELAARPPMELARAFPGFGSVMRTSWTDPQASYVAHLNRYFVHHFDPGDPNSIIYHAKGVPLCLDFGHRGATSEQVNTMWRPDYHSTVSFDKPDSPAPWPAAGGSPEASTQAQEVRSLPATVDYSTGISFGGGGQSNRRHLLLVKSADQMGATYLVMRDVTTDGQPNQVFTWNLWCLAKEPQVAGNVAHFPGMYGVDLDAHVLLPADPQFVKDHYAYEQWVHPWGKFSEEQSAVHVKKVGSAVDFLALLYPRAAGQGPAEVTALADGAALRVKHMEGMDLVLLSPVRAAAAAEGEMQVSGQMACARRYNDGRLRLAVVKAGQAGLGEWRLSGAGPVAVEVNGRDLRGECSGPEAQSVVLTVPADFGEALVTVDGKIVAVRREGRELTLSLPAGSRRFTVQAK